MLARGALLGMDIIGMDILAFLGGGNARWRGDALRSIALQFRGSFEGIVMSLLVCRMCRHSLS